MLRILRTTFIDGTRLFAANSNWGAVRCPRAMLTEKRQVAVPLADSRQASPSSATSAAKGAATGSGI
jgi:hypothetical protein